MYLGVHSHDGLRAGPCASPGLGVVKRTRTPARVNQRQEMSGRQQGMFGICSRSRGTACQCLPVPGPLEAQWRAPLPAVLSVRGAIRDSPEAAAARARRPGGVGFRYPWPIPAPGRLHCCGRAMLTASVVKLSHILVPNPGNSAQYPHSRILYGLTRPAGLRISGPEIAAAVVRP